MQTVLNEIITVSLSRAAFYVPLAEVCVWGREGGAGAAGAAGREGGAAGEERFAG